MLCGRVRVCLLVRRQSAVSSHHTSGVAPHTYTQHWRGPTHHTCPHRVASTPQVSQAPILLHIYYRGWGVGGIRASGARTKTFSCPPSASRNWVSIFKAPPTLPHNLARLPAPSLDRGGLFGRRSMPPCAKAQAHGQAASSTCVMSTRRLSNEQAERELIQPATEQRGGASVGDEQRGGGAPSAEEANGGPHDGQAGSTPSRGAAVDGAAGEEGKRWKTMKIVAATATG